MRDLDEASITRAVLDKVSQGKSARGREISTALIRHFHDFVREVRPSEAEWEAAIAFLTRTGQMCDDRRQEFILLSDTLGVSMLVDAINHQHPGESTETTVFGPFFVQDAPIVGSGDNIAGRLEGPPLLIVGRVVSETGAPLPGAVVDVWHADADGFYDVQLGGDEQGGRGRVTAGEDGRFHLWTILPSPYPIPDDGPVGEMLAMQGRHPFRPAHVHFMVHAPGHERLVTHLFLEGSDYLDSDVVFGVKQSLIKPVERREAGVTEAGDSCATPYFLLRADIGLALETCDRSRLVA